MALDFLYDLPNGLVLFIFVIVILALALIGLYIFIILTSEGFDENFSDQNTGTILGAVAVAIALVIAFIITNEYQTYSQTSSNLVTEANTIYALIQTLLVLDDTGTLSGEAIFYLCSIITVEFPLMSEGIVPPNNVFLDELQAGLIDLDPVTEKDLVLYSKALDLLNEAIALRNSRLEQVTGGLAKEFYWLLIIGVSLLIALTWFINGSFVYRVLIISFITIIYSTLLFLVFVLDLPFQGDFSLNASPFIEIANRLSIVCPTNASLRNESICRDSSRYVRNRVAKCNKCNTNNL